MVVFNPARRNRNIGTARQGHGLNNRMVVPQLSGANWSCKAQIGAHKSFHRTVNGQDITIIAEETTGGCIHACSPDDVEAILSHIPRSDLEGLSTFVLRQSTQKTRQLSPAWGRLFYWADIAVGGTAMIKSGPIVFLDAHMPGKKLRWSASLDRDQGDELERLRADGHRIERIGRHYIVTSDVAAVRATQLYMTLPHEIGHWVDFLEKVEIPSNRGEDFCDLQDLYFARPQAERERYAHRYADTLRDKLAGMGVIPFDKTQN